MACNILLEKNVLHWQMTKSYCFHSVSGITFYYFQVSSNILRDGYPTKLSKICAVIGDATKTAGTTNVVYMEEWLCLTICQKTQNKPVKKLENEAIISVS